MHTTIQTGIQCNSSVRDRNSAHSLKLKRLWVKRIFRTAEIASIIHKERLVQIVECQIRSCSLLPHGDTAGKVCVQPGKSVISFRRTR